MSVAEDLAAGWIKHFWAADHAIKWGRIEYEHSLWLDGNTLLVGRIDADGHTEDGDFFFADWKTLGPKKRIAQVKAEYRFDPQMLTYGLLTHGSGNRFLVRWAQKTATPLYHYEWYSYTDAEVAWWRNMLLNIAAKIRSDSATLKPFVTNLTNCLRYGTSYACPFLENGCAKQNFDYVGADMVPRVSHLDIERKLIAEGTDLHNGHEYVPFTDVLILDASRTETWLECNEKYRKKYLVNIAEPPGEALTVGIEFHDIMHKYYGGLSGRATK